MSVAQLQTALSFLAAARQAVPDAETASVYLTALSDMDPGLVERACRQLANEPRREFDPVLPSVGTIRERCDHIVKADATMRANARLLPAPKSSDEPTYFCTDCFDEPNGWRFFYCRGKGDVPLKPTPDRMTDYPCSRLKAHMPHPYVERCACLPTNPVIAQARERMHVTQLKRTKHEGHAA